MDGRVPGTAVPPTIRRKLAGLRRAVRWRLGLDGAAALFALALALAAINFLVDRHLRMDRTQRALSLGLAAAGLAGLAYRRLARPLARRLDDATLCRIVEARHAELGERLIAAVEFARAADAESAGCSAAMVRASVDAGAQAAAALDMRDVLDARRRNRNLAVAASAVAVAAVAALLAPDTARVWFDRNVLLGDSAWPQETRLSVLGAADGALTCPRGDDLTLQVRAEGVIPSLVSVSYRQSGGAGQEPMAQSGPDLFTAVFRNVLDPFKLRVAGGDAETPWIEVRLVDRPAVDSLALVCAPPAYVGRPPQTLPADVGSYPILVGSTVRIEGRSSKPLKEATLALGSAKPAPLDLAGPNRFRAVLAGERLLTGTYAVGLVDTDGYASRTPTRFSLKVVPDQKPSVRAKLLGIGGLVVSRAVVPIHARMADDYAVQSADLVVSVATEGETEPVARRVPFGDRRDAFGRTPVELVHRLDLVPMRLKAGSHVTLQVEAKDNDAVSGPKVGVSGAFVLRVVTEDELRQELLRREQEQRLEFERVLLDQQRLLETTRALDAALRRDGAAGLANRERDLLTSSERQQRLVGGRCLAIAEQFIQLLAEIENNRLEEDARQVRERLQVRIIDPLGQLSRRGVLQAADLLDMARKALSEGAAPAAPKTLAEAAAEQERLVAAMREILRHMVKWEGYQEAVTFLREVLKSQKQVNEETAKEHVRRIQKIFD